MHKHVVCENTADVVIYSSCGPTCTYSSLWITKSIHKQHSGVTCYENFFTHQELNDIEKQIQETEQSSLNDGFLPMTA